LSTICGHALSRILPRRLPAATTAGHDREVLRTILLRTSLLVGLVGCASPATQLIVVVDTDLRIPGELDSLEIVVTPEGGEARSREEMLDGSDLGPFTLGIAPSGESLGPIHVEAIGRLGDSLVVERDARVSLVRGETLTLILHLARACIGASCPAGTTCVETGECEDIDAPTILPWTGRPPRLFEDAAVPVDGGSDAGPRDGAIGDGGDAGGDCRIDGCEDDNPCTEDLCNEAHVCAHPPSAVACDDGVFCNGLDQCVGGTCSGHSGDTCAAPTTCDETNEVCLGCEVDDDCPDPLTGVWSSCTAMDACATAGTETRTVRTFTCVANRCEPADDDESRACARTTEGDSCAASTCGTYGTCTGGSDVCATTGTATRTCTDYACAAGACTPASRSDSMACTRATDGVSCGSLSCDSWSGCGGFADVCALSGTESRTCATPVCGGGTCGSAPSMESRGCTRPSTDGTVCPGMASCGVWSACNAMDPCAPTGTRSRTCNDPVCSGGSCGSVARTETEGCSRGSTDGVVCGADSCGPYGTCAYSTICDETGTQTRTCNQLRCQAGSCATVNPYTDPLDCTRDRTGVACGGGGRTCIDGICECTFC
jgi:hypothetical protein